MTRSEGGFPGAGLIPGLVVTHGDLGRELIRLVESILGPQPGVTFLSNTGASLESLRRSVRAVLEEMGGEGQPVFVFVDLLGGSCGQVCQGVVREEPQAVVFSGVNLPMLLEFAYKRGRLAPRPLAGEILRKAREGIQCLAPNSFS